MIEKKGIYSKIGFTLIEMLVCVGVIAILVGIAASRFFPIIERSRAGEARAILSAIYHNFQVVAEDGNPLDQDLSSVDPDIDWNKILMDDPNDMPNSWFNYDVDNDNVNPTAPAESKADDLRWLEIDLNTGVITSSSEYQ